RRGDHPGSGLRRRERAGLGPTVLRLAPRRGGRGRRQDRGVAANPLTLRLVTFNIQHGLGPGGRCDRHRPARAVGELDPDILALPEVDRYQPRSGFVDQARLCADAMGATDYRYLPTVAGWMSAPGLRWRAHGDERLPAYGIALATRLPVRAWRRW